MLSDTRPSLLERLGQADEPMAWEDFFERYWPTIYGYARRRGCSEHTAEEIVQDVMLKVFRQRDVFQYDRQRGRFRDWLGTVVRNQIAEWHRRPAQRIRPVGGDGFPQDVHVEEASESPEEIWNQTFEHSLLLVLLDVVRRETNPRHYLAFELSTLRDMTASEVARVTGLTRHVIYKTRQKLLARLQQLAGSYADDGSLTIRVKQAIQLRASPIVQRQVTRNVTASVRSGQRAPSSES